jgi:hypothetical protein
MRRWIFSVVAIAIAILLASQVHAFDWRSYDSPATHTYTGVPLDAPQRVELQGRVLMVPAGYFFDWFKADPLDTRDRRFQDLFIHFWMPSKQFPRFNELSIEGRVRRDKPLDPATYVVSASIGFRKREELNSSVYWNAINNMTKKLFGRAHTIETTSFGLEHAWIDRRDGRKNEVYRSMQDQNPEFGLTCVPDEKVVHDCEGTVYIASDELAFSIFLPRAAIPQWREISFAVRDLVHSWQEKPENSE